MSNSLIGLIVVLVILNVGVWIWVIIARNSLWTCENNESIQCPSYYCTYSNTKCPEPNSHAPYRYLPDGQVMCQGYSLKVAVTNNAHTSTQMPAPNQAPIITS